jgi:hypothetical protein
VVGVFLVPAKVAEARSDRVVARTRKGIFRRMSGPVDEG